MQWNILQISFKKDKYVLNGYLIDSLLICTIHYYYFIIFNVYLMIVLLLFSLFFFSWKKYSFCFLIHISRNQIIDDELFLHNSFQFMHIFYKYKKLKIKKKKWIKQYQIIFFFFRLEELHIQ